MIPQFREALKKEIDDLLFSDLLNEKDTKLIAEVLRFDLPGNAVKGKFRMTSDRFNTHYQFNVFDMFDNNVGRAYYKESVFDGDDVDWRIKSYVYKIYPKTKEEKLQEKIDYDIARVGILERKRKRLMGKIKKRLMPFGKYKDKSLDVVLIDISYRRWLLTQEEFLATYPEYVEEINKLENTKENTKEIL